MKEIRKNVTVNTMSELIKTIGENSDKQYSLSIVHLNSYVYGDKREFTMFNLGWTITVERQMSPEELKALKDRKPVKFAGLNKKQNESMNRTLIMLDEAAARRGNKMVSQFTVPCTDKFTQNGDVDLRLGFDLIGAYNKFESLKGGTITEKEKTLLSLKSKMTPNDFLIHAIGLNLSNWSTETKEDTIFDATKNKSYPCHKFTLPGEILSRILMALNGEDNFVIAKTIDAANSTTEEIAYFMDGDNPRLTLAYTNSNETVKIKEAVAKAAEGNKDNNVIVDNLPF